MAPLHVRLVTMGMFGETIPFMFKLQSEAAFHSPNPVGVSLSRFLPDNVSPECGGLWKATSPRPLPDRPRAQAAGAVGREQAASITIKKCDSLRAGPAAFPLHYPGPKVKASSWLISGAILSTGCATTFARSSLSFAFLKSTLTPKPQ